MKEVKHIQMEDKLLISLSDEERQFMIKHIKKQYDIITNIFNGQNYIEADCFVGDSCTRQSIFLYQSGIVSIVKHK